jgi:hypothetical protein
MALPPSAAAVQAKAARITRVIKDVKLLPHEAPPRPAAESDSVSGGTAVRTGLESRAELTFGDETITRLGANTIFTFNEGTRTVDLGSGALLVQVPRNGGEAKVITAAVTAAISGGTALVESHKTLPTKFLVLEGIGHFYPNGRPSEAVILHGGEMVMMTVNGQITRPTKFNAKLVFTTAKLLTEFDPLPNTDLILAVIAEQEAEQTGTASSTGPSDTTDSTDLRFAALPPAVGASAKFGPPSVIKSPNPYVINSGTVINTDPKITTNGQTNFGKIYRGPGEDGSLLSYLGASTTSFDTASGEPTPGEALPLPVFLFSALQIDGNPTVSTAGGGPPNLGLGSLGGITFSPSGAAITFSGIAHVGLLALNGSIDTTGVSFANFGDLFMEARGGGSDLTFGSPVSNLNGTHLVAEGSLFVNAPVSVSDEFKAFAGNNVQANSTVNANQIKVESLGAINISNSGQLLAMLNSTGSSGQVLLAASGSDTSVTVNGIVQADQGEVDIRQTGLAGMVDLGNATLHGDIIKVSVLGTNGVLNIGAGNTLSADTIIKLYAPGSNGTLNFLSNVTLNSTQNVLAANTINIAQGVVVTISNSTARPADVFTNNPNYFGFGGTGTPATSGTFGGAGARNPQPLSNAPPLGAPGTGP